MLADRSEHRLALQELREFSVIDQNEFFRKCDSWPNRPVQRRREMI